jgi:hypothetical protein
MANLDGQTLLVLGQGRINTKYINLLGRDLATVLLQMLSPAKRTQNFTQVNCAICRLQSRQGLAKIQTLVLDTPETSVVAEGNVNLKTEALQLSFAAVPKKGVGGFSLSLAELIRLFKMEGTLAKPRMAFDRQKSALSIGKAIGGTLLFGPAGIAAALVSGQSKGENPCVAAEKAAEEGVQLEEFLPEQQKGKGVTQKASGAVKRTVKGVGDSFKKIFGK